MNTNVDSNSLNSDLITPQSCLIRNCWKLQMLALSQVKQLVLRYYLYNKMNGLNFV